MLQSRTEVAHAAPATSSSAAFSSFHPSSSFNMPQQSPWQHVSMSVASELTTESNKQARLSINNPYSPGMQPRPGAEGDLVSPGGSVGGHGELDLSFLPPESPLTSSSLGAYTTGSVSMGLVSPSECAPAACADDITETPLSLEWGADSAAAAAAPAVAADADTTAMSSPSPLLLPLSPLLLPLSPPLRPYTSVHFPLASAGESSSLLWHSTPRH